MANEREQNPNWRGGRTIASNGYVLIRVGAGHHLADVRGYAYEHRLVAEQKIGRRLLPGELVHHIDENKQNNHPDNLEVVFSDEHGVRHRKGDRGKRLPGEGNPEIECACGCGARFLRFDGSGRPRKFISGHNNESGLRDLVLAYLEWVPEPGTPEWIASMSGCNERSVGNMLRRLRREGLVVFDRGEWRLAS